MTKQLAGRQGAILGLGDSRALYGKLQHDATRLAASWGVYEAFDFAVTAWHLQDDWVKSDPPNSLCRIKRGRTQRPSEMQLVLEIVRDLANGSKHFHLNPEGQKARRVTATRTGMEPDWWSYFWHEDMPGVSVGSSEFSIRVLRNLMMAYFEWVFDDTVPPGSFPSEIVETVSYCDVSARKPPFTPPELWSKD